MTNEPTANERFAFIVEKLWDSQVAACEELNFSQPAISLMISGKRNISRKILQNISKIKPQVNIDWILSGDGEWEKRERIGEMYHIDEAKPRTLVDLEKQHKDDPLFALKEKLANYESRISALEEKILAMERERRYGQGDN